MCKLDSSRRVALNHKMTLAFSNDVDSGHASITTGIGSISGSPILAANTMTTNLTGVPDFQKITVTLTGVTDSKAVVLPDTPLA